MIFHLDDLLLFPLSFGVLILQKTYSVSRSALIPTVVNNKTELVEANSKLGLISGAIGALAAAPAGAPGGDLAEAVVAVRRRDVRRAPSCRRHAAAARSRWRTVGAAGRDAWSCATRRSGRPPWR